MCQEYPVGRSWRSSKFACLVSRGCAAASEQGKRPAQEDRMLGIDWDVITCSSYHENSYFQPLRHGSVMHSSYSCATFCNPFPMCEVICTARMHHLQILLFDFQFQSLPPRICNTIIQYGPQSEQIQDSTSAPGDAICWLAPEVCSHPQLGSAWGGQMVAPSAALQSFGSIWWAPGQHDVMRRHLKCVLMAHDGNQHPTSRYIQAHGKCLLWVHGKAIASETVGTTGGFSAACFSADLSPKSLVGSPDATTDSLAKKTWIKSKERILDERTKLRRLLNILNKHK